jgi:hypothetical protein
VVRDFEAAAATVDSRLVGHISAGVVLHDRRAAAIMARTLSQTGVESASLVLLSLDKRGKGWIANPADAGELRTTGQEIADDAAVALELWRASWPVARPPRDLWLTRAETLTRWLEKPASAIGQHICSSFVTASYGAAPPASEITLTPPPSDHALSVERLFG